MAGGRVKDVDEILGRETQEIMLDDLITMKEGGEEGIFEGFGEESGGDAVAEGMHERRKDGSGKREREREEGGGGDGGGDRKRLRGVAAQGGLDNQTMPPQTPPRDATTRLQEAAKPPPVTPGSAIAKRTRSRRNAYAEVPIPVQPRLHTTPQSPKCENITAATLREAAAPPRESVTPLMVTPTGGAQGKAGGAGDGGKDRRVWTPVSSKKPNTVHSFCLLLNHHVRFCCPLCTFSPRDLMRESPITLIHPSKMNACDTSPLINRLTSASTSDWLLPLQMRRMQILPGSHFHVPRRQPVPHPEAGPKSLHRQERPLHFPLGQRSECVSSREILMMMTKHPCIKESIRESEIICTLNRIRKHCP